MTALDNKFFEEYKMLDKLCKEIYSAQNGVSEYISDMETQLNAGSEAIPDFEKDYKTLKHLRWVRNQIAHTPAADAICKKEDFAALKKFYGRILKGEDPLIKLKVQRTKKRGHTRRKYEKSGENSRYFFIIFIATLIFLIIAVLLISR